MYNVHTVCTYCSSSRSLYCICILYTVHGSLGHIGIWYSLYVFKYILSYFVCMYKYLLSSSILV